ncbi:hypothetical protein V498_05202 [Pseudogymnoascus sp. VKM F-4517 (FW-2822)]|nr:hypothetical protein V498_05202 [Pseudogymnoascus sp. VKM F-4517 (FW-2822)]
MPAGGEADRARAATTSLYSATWESKARGDGGGTPHRATKEAEGDRPGRPATTRREGTARATTGAVKTAA